MYTQVQWRAHINFALTKWIIHWRSRLQCSSTVELLNKLSGLARQRKRGHPCAITIRWGDLRYHLRFLFYHLWHLSTHCKVPNMNPFSCRQECHLASYINLAFAFCQSCKICDHWAECSAQQVWLLIRRHMQCNDPNFLSFSTTRLTHAPFHALNHWTRSM
jgi:hypothetical protein